MKAVGRHKPAMGEIAGPYGSVDYQRDRLGYPTLFARDLEEGTFALGYMHAKDRLTQVTLTALAARGELMATLGDIPIARLIDQSTRALGLTRDLSEQAARCDPASQRLLRAYSAGFNAGARARGVPLALRALGVAPFTCSAEGVLSIFRFVTYFGLTSMQLSSELIIAELAARGAPARVFERLLGLSARGIDLDALRNLQIPREFRFFSGAFGSPAVGSNAFAVDKQRSESGGALLMGEFHMEVGRFPPLLYAAHLELPNDYLSGITIPGMAWFAAGRTRNVGWSYTFAHADNVDFLVERVKDGKYLSGGEYHPLRRRVETVKVRRKPSENWVFYENDYGVLFGDAQVEAERVCVRASGFDQTHRAFSAASRVLDCKSVDELLEIQREVKSVSLEAILVDRGGRIASIVTGQVDERPADWTGAYPRPGWDSTERNPSPLPEERRPTLVDPESGVLASANQGGQGPHRAEFCTFPEPPYRFERILELLADRPRHDLKSLLKISYDVFDASARRLIPIWAPLMADQALALTLGAWVVDQKDRKLLGLFHKLHEEVSCALLEEDIGGEPARRFREWSAFAFFQQQLDSVLALEKPDLLDEAGLRRLLAAALPKALAGFATHEVPVRLRFRHLVTQGRSPAFLGFDSAEIELPGSPVTAFQCRVSPVSGEKLVYAPAFHILFDMKDDRVFYNLPGGASESRFGPGYGKGVDLWLHGELLPLGCRTREGLRL